MENCLECLMNTTIGEKVTDEVNLDYTYGGRTTMSITQFTVRKLNDDSYGVAHTQFGQSWTKLPNWRLTQEHWMAAGIHQKLVNYLKCSALKMLREEVTVQVST